MTTNKPGKGIPVVSKIPTSGRDSGTHSRSSSVSNLTTASDIHSEAGDAASEGALDFKVNDRVWVNGTKPGCVKFIGKTQFAPGVWAGVLLDEAVGKNDGSVGGVKYFSCPPLRGIFARPQKLSKTCGGISETGDSPSPAPSTPRNPGFATPTSRGLTASNLSLSSTKGICSRLRLGERVVVSSTTGDKSGILKFLGTTDFAKGEWAGICLDEPVGKNDGSVAGKRYFTCQMKYGLFAPLHKVSRAGGTCTPKPASSVRGTPLMRSSSRDSLSSSVSTSSKASRVKLGITSLTNSQQKARSTGIGLMTTSRALEEVLKEKELHIEQLLKEHDIERAELAKVASQCEEAVTKYNELVNLQQTYENDRKDLENQLSSEKRKFEDLQFQLEEEKITRGDLEMQLQKQNQILNRLGSFLNEKLDPKFVNIKEIIEEKENLSIVPEQPSADPQAALFKERIVALEAELESQKQEKIKCMQELENLQKVLNNSNKEHESILATLNNTNQEKDDVIANLKNELNIEIEKVTKLIEENKSLTEQISSQTSEAKGHSESVKELGEKINLLSEELKSKVNLLKENEITIQEKDSKISTLDNNLESQTQQIVQLQNQNQILNQDLEQKILELNEKLKLQKSLEDEVASIKMQLESDIPKKEEKILDLVKKLEEVTTNLQEKEEELIKKQNEVLGLQKKSEELSETNSMLQVKIKELEENISFMNKDSSEKVISLEKKVQTLIEEKEGTINNFEKEKQTKQSEFETLKNELESYKSALSDAQSQLSVLTQTAKEKDSEIIVIKNELDATKKTCEALDEEKARYEQLLKEKAELLSSFEKQLSETKNEADKTNEELTVIKKKTDELSHALKEKEEAITQLTSKLQLAEQNVEMLNRDSSEHVTTLQNELSKLKEESVKTKSSLEEQLTEIQLKKEELISEINEKDNVIKKKEESLSTLKSQLKTKENDISVLSHEKEKIEKEIADLVKDKEEIQILNEKNTQALKEHFDSEWKKKDELLSNSEKQFSEARSTIDKLNVELTGVKKETDTLCSVLNQKEEDIAQLNSKLQLAEQNVEMLNRDSSEHVTTLQGELSKLKEESVKTKTTLEQKISELQKKNEELLSDIKEKNIAVKEKEESLSMLEKQINLKENDVSNLSQQLEKLNNEISTLTKEKEEMHLCHEKQSQSEKEKFGTELKKKDQKLTEILESNEKLSKTISEQSVIIGGKDEMLFDLQNQLKTKETEVSNLSSQEEKLKQELNEKMKNNEELKVLHEKQLLSSKENFEAEMKNKEMVLEESQGKSSELNKLLVIKEKELQQKESEINSLRNIVKEKESQFDELSQMIEASQAQLKVLTDQNENNVKLLESKESFIENFKADKEKQLLDLEENLKKENSRLQDLLQKYENDVLQKQEIITKLNTEAEEQKKHIELITDELVKSKAAAEKTHQNTNEAHQDFISKIAELEAKYSQLLEEKKMVEVEESKAQGAKKNLEEMRDNLLQEKVQREEVVKDRESQLAVLQVEVNRMQTEFTLHKQELQQKLDVSEMELQAALELKNQLELQHSVLEELQQELQNSEDRCKQLEMQVQNTSNLSSEKTELLDKLSKYEKLDLENSEKLSKLEEKYQSLQETLKNTQNSLAEKEIECASLKEKILSVNTQLESNDHSKASITTLEQENILLKHRIEKLESGGSEKNANKAGDSDVNQAFAEERESLISQIDFLNSIIVDMKQKNENLQQEIELLKMGPEVVDSNFNDTPKKIAPRLFCDICDMFDLHDTEDCPKQESYVEDEPVPHLIPQGARKMDERPYCNNCEMFGHWTFDCEEQETY
ncbi:CAP-Gly domain-containing linker protein 2 [Trichonephila clavata]|uniref:CAP-Gly domain-containing linker protein 2 n=1 Tax=Trichonephila clavata TaxID=2740835 RepID=A0A8X6JAD7_TRICU|nr:CAP-Gly domain-containing linker protein 2 [Trichonephila clavata]